MAEHIFGGEIASADDADISRVLLEWSGTAVHWNRFALSTTFDFWTDIAAEWSALEITTEEWSNLPGHGGVWYSVFTDDETEARAEMRARLATLLWQNRVLVRVNLQRVRAAARRRDAIIRGGPVRRIALSIHNAIILIDDLERNGRDSLSVSAQHWSDIGSGQSSK